MKLFHIAAPAAIAGVLLLAPAHAQQPGHDQHQNHQTTPQRSGMMDHDKMMMDMKAADDRLEALSESMKSAQGDEKILAMQEVVSELVRNQIDMHRQMGMMHGRMMSQMPHK